MFLGCLGIDRCYLGFPALGFLKFSTCGGFLLWWLLDVLLIASQKLLPSDTSEYIFFSHSEHPRMFSAVFQNHSFVTNWKQANDGKTRKEMIYVFVFTRPSFFQGWKHGIMDVWKQVLRTRKNWLFFKVNLCYCVVWFQSFDK